MGAMPHRSRLHVRFGDVDHARIVYYPRFLNYFHVAFEQFWEEAMGIPYHVVMGERNLAFPAVNIDVDFEVPLRFGDVVEVETWVKSIGTSSVRFGFAVFRGETRTAKATITTVALDMERFAKIPVPEWVLPLLEAQRRPEEG